MKKIFVCLIAFACMYAPVLAETAGDEAAVLATLESWNRGWAEKDAALAVQDYSDDTDWTNAFGDRFQTREALQEGLEFIFSLDFVMAGDSAGNEFADVTFLTPDIALIRSKLVREGQQFSTGEVRPDRHINHLRVLERRDGKWQIVSHMISQALEKR
ncbi:YybH family protein [Hyphococcus sp.]|jgi:uncharacterized protein (TIGR02246 family)|uniref:YybH family protein n=1 Tax=Hyphococcus sp. TaxID=2038636 RepID=UPI003D0CAF21